MIRKFAFALLRAAIAVSALDLFFVLLQGGYRVPFTSLRSSHPATSVAVLIFLTLLYHLLAYGRGRAAWTTSRTSRVIFLSLWLIFLINFRWRGSGDVVGPSLLPFALLREGTLYLDSYYAKFLSDKDISCVYQRNGRVISMYSAAPGLLLTPFYALPAMSPVEVTDLLIHQLQKIGASFMVALSAYVVFLTLNVLVKKKWAVILTFAYALGTSSWSSSSQAIWQHGPSKLFISLGLYFIVRELYGKFDNARSGAVFMWSGFFFAFAVWCRYTNIFIYAGVLGFIALCHKRYLWRFALGSVAPAAALLADNFFHSGNLFKTGYSQAQVLHFTKEWPVGLFGLLVSPSRGLFTYTPFLLFSVWGYAKAFKRTDMRLWWGMGFACCAVVLFYSIYAYWLGGWCFGPRQIGDVLPFLILGIVPLVKLLEEHFWIRRTFFLSLFYSILVHGLGAFFTWRWESIPAQKWSWSNYPVTYLLTQLWTRPTQDLPQACLVLAALLSLMIWFIWPWLRPRSQFLGKAAAAVILAGLIPVVSGAELSAQEYLARGQQAFQQQRWREAISNFTEVLRQDPGHEEAHQYVRLSVREIESANRAVVRTTRLRLLEDASTRLGGSGLETAPIETAIANTTQVEERARQERWENGCEQARIERRLGHLPAANDLILRVIAENPHHQKAQQELSELQIALRQALETGSGLSVPERYVLQGFYAYGQADYAAAAAAWGKLATLVKQTYPAEEAAKRLSAWRFETYAKHANAIVGEAARREEIRVRFASAMDLYHKGRFAQALETFRQVALADAEFPQLAYYLVQAEARSEKERTRLLTQQKRKQIAAAFDKSLSYLEREQYAEAERAFREVLALDPSHPQANSYLTVVQAELHRRHDPKAAQEHYEAGLIAYAGGKLEEASREWTIAVRMNAQHQKAANALRKVRKELALNQTGSRNEALP